MNAKTLTLAGAVVLIIGLFLPVASVASISMNLIMPPGQGVSVIGLILAACALLALVLALVNQAKWAVIPGVVALGFIVWQFLDAKSKLDEMTAGTAGADVPPEAAQMIAAMAPSLNYLGWGVMVLGAVVILVGGAMGFKSRPPAV